MSQLTIYREISVRSLACNVDQRFFASAPFRWLVAALSFALLQAVLGPESVAEESTANEPVQAVTVDQERFFESEIRPLLANACGNCHGAKKAESGLRTDSREALLVGGYSGPAINLDDKMASLLLDAVHYEGEIRMPPDQKLADDKIAALRKWIEQGAPWPNAGETALANPLGLRSGPITDADRQHWAYQPVVKPSVPIHDLSAQWARTDIDRFLLADMSRHDVQPGIDADRRTWLRRLTYDLTGLPPTNAEVQDFIADQSPEADAHVIDRLLQSPHFGERWGRHWLDVVRYADTAGDGADYPIREAYKYRDYVIASLNNDKPYDQFLREQIAGDILANQSAAIGDITPEQYANQVTATGYIAMTKRFGYNINTEFQHLDIADTLDNFGQSILGLSIGCARCHDHKYDAITAEDYYALYGIFASSQYTFPGGEEYKKPHNLVPLALPSVVKAAQQRVADQVNVLDASLAEIERKREQWTAQNVVGVSRDPGLEMQTIGKPGSAPWFTAGPNTITAEAQSPFDHVQPIGSQGIRVSYGNPTDGVRQEFSDVTAEKSPVFYFNFDFRNTEAVDGPGGYRFFLARGALQSLAIQLSVDSRQVKITNGDKSQFVRDLKPGDWYNVQLKIDLLNKTYSGHIGSSGDVVSFEDFSIHPSWDGVLNTFVSDGFGEDQSKSPTRDIDNVIGQFEPFPALEDDPSIRPTPTTPSPDFVAVKKELEDLDVESKRLQAERMAVESSLSFPMAYGVTEGTPNNAKVQRRGEPDRLGDEVPRRFLQILGGDLVPEEYGGSGRLQLAEWVTRDSNPLVARVIVNRVWQHLFGRGLVDTPNDFGTRGASPSHPELLDFLAAEFVEDGWSIKRLIRRITLSRAYRLTSHPTAQQKERDPENLWFARHRRRSLDAESIRDSVLAVSGELDTNSGGPHPFPEVDSWNFTIHYPFHAVYDSNHRSVYLMSQRARRHPFLALFDAADPNISTATRQVTITPMQSLYLMNAPLLHTNADRLATRILERVDQAATDQATDQTVTMVYEAILARQPSEAEISQATDFLSRSQEVLRSGSDAPDLQQATAAFCRVLLTSNEFLYVD